MDDNHPQCLRAAEWMNEHFGDTLDGEEGDDYIRETASLLQQSALEDGIHIPEEAFQTVLIDWIDSAYQGTDSLWDEEYLETNPTQVIRALYRYHDVPATSGGELINNLKGLGFIREIDGRWFNTSAALSYMAEQSRED